MECLTSTDPEDDYPNIDRIIVVSTGTKKDYRNLDPSIKSYAQTEVALDNLLIYICNIKGNYSSIHNIYQTD